MKRIILAFLCIGVISALHAQKDDKKKPAVAPPSSTSADSTKKVDKKSITDKIKSSKKAEGLFTVYQDTATGSTQLYIKKDQLDKEFIYQSFSLSGPTSLFLNQSMHRANLIFKIRKVFDRVEFATQNTNFYYDSNNAVSKSANVDVAEATFLSEKIAAEDSAGYLIASDGLFVSEKLDPVRPIIPPGPFSSMIFNLGSLNSSKSRVSNIRSYPDNTDVIVELAYDNSMPFNGGGKDITDARYNKVKLQHSFLEIPKNTFRARKDDPRLGYFTSEIDDLTSSSATPFKDVINRWHLVKKDPKAAISEPVEPIVWWIENTTPVELRETVMEAGNKWNEAFEKAGFKNAVVMKQMPDTASWDPADIRYNVIRWVSSSARSYGAIGPSFTNPRNGQILGSDITVEWATGAGAPPYLNEIWDTRSLVQLMDQQKEGSNSFLNSQQMQHWANCQMARELSAQFSLGQTAISAFNDDENAAKEVSVLHKQYLYYLILHEMGHTLGLNHNMKASQMLSPAEINNKAITEKIGLMGSVMDYPAVNVSLDKTKQGDYFTIKPGPYDLWAIQYGYTPFEDTQEDAGLNTILSRSNEPQLAFGNDADDMRSFGSGIDPRVMINDLSNDVITYSEERFKLINNIMLALKNKFVKPNESYASLRARFNYLQAQRAQAAAAVANYVGGVKVERSFPGQNASEKPFTPISAEYQRKAIGLLAKYLFAPNAFEADTYLFPYLQLQRRGFNFFGATEDPKPQNIVMNMQMQALARMLNSVTLQRVNTSSLYGNQFSTADLMNELVKAIFSADLNSNVNLYRQNLQAEFVKGVSAMANATTGYDNPSKAASLATLKKLKPMLTAATMGDAQTKAHRTNLLFNIEKALSIN